MTTHLLPRKVLATNWNEMPGSISDFDCAQAIPIVRKGAVMGNRISSRGGESHSPDNAVAKTAGTLPTVDECVLRILMVEDNEDDCELICHRLKKCGYKYRVKRVFCEETMREALEREQWDVMFTDHGLPGFNALEAIALLRKLRPLIPVLCITGSVDPLIIRQILAAGARTCISKDDLSLLGVAVERALAESSNKGF